MKKYEEKIALAFILLFGVPMFGIALAVIWGMFLSMLSSIFWG